MDSLRNQLKAWKARATEAGEKERAAKVAPPPPQAKHGALKGQSEALIVVRRSVTAPASPKAREVGRPTSDAKKPAAAPVDFRTAGVLPVGSESGYRDPASWVAGGGSHQAADGGVGRDLTVRLGIDFGTAYTKAALSAAQRTFVIDWDGIHQSDSRLYLPGVISIAQDGTSKVGRSPHSKLHLSDLKIPFLPNQVNDEDSRLAATVFLAWVMRYSRAWLFRSQPALCADRKITWEVNIGCPTLAWDNKAILDLYKFVGHAAWRLSSGTEPIEITRARTILNGVAQPFQSDGLDALDVIPEFVAQIAGYVRSPQRRRGLHLLVDCGAGTVDAVTFNVHKNEDEPTDCYPIFAAAVEPLGGHFLMAARANALGAGAWDNADRIPSAEEIVEVFPDTRDALGYVDREFRRKISGVVESLIRKTRFCRTPLAIAWDEGLPVFVTGGGATSEVYFGAVAEASTAAKAGFLNTPLPGPRGVDGVEEAHFHRLSVAFGLTIDSASLGRIVPEKDIENFYASQAYPNRNRLDRDDLYPK